MFPISHIYCQLFYLSTLPLLYRLCEFASLNASVLEICQLVIIIFPFFLFLYKDLDKRKYRGGGGGGTWKVIIHGL